MTLFLLASLSQLLGLLVACGVLAFCGLGLALSHKREMRQRSLLEALQEDFFLTNPSPHTRQRDLLLHGEHKGLWVHLQLSPRSTLTISISQHAPSPPEDQEPSLFHIPSDLKLEVKQGSQAYNRLLSQADTILRAHLREDPTAQADISLDVDTIHFTWQSTDLPNPTSIRDAVLQTTMCFRPLYTYFRRHWERELLQEALHHPNPARRYAQLHALRKYAPASANTAVKQFFHTQSDQPALRRQLIDSFLQDPQCPASLKQLIQQCALQDPDPQNRLHAAIHDPQSARLLTLFADKSLSAEVRFQALLHLHKSLSPSAFSTTLQTALQEEEEPFLRRAALITLAPQQLPSPPLAHSRLHQTLKKHLNTWMAELAEHHKGTPKHPMPPLPQEAWHKLTPLPPNSWSESFLLDLLPHAPSARIPTFCGLMRGLQETAFSPILMQWLEHQPLQHQLAACRALERCGTQENILPLLSFTNLLTSPPKLNVAIRKTIEAIRERLHPEASPGSLSLAPQQNPAGQLSLSSSPGNLTVTPSPDDPPA